MHSTVYWLLDSLKFYSYCRNASGGGGRISPLLSIATTRAMYARPSITETSPVQIAVPWPGTSPLCFGSSSATGSGAFTGSEGFSSASARALTLLRVSLHTGTDYRIHTEAFPLVASQKRKAIIIPSTDTKVTPWVPNRSYVHSKQGK